MLNECYSHYFSQRDLLLQPSVRASITQLAKTHSTSSCYLVRNFYTLCFVKLTVNENFRSEAGVVF